MKQISTSFIMKAGANIRMHFKYIFVILKTSESDPKTVVKDLERKILTSTNTIDITVAK